MKRIIRAIVSVIAASSLCVTGLGSTVLTVQAGATPAERPVTIQALCSDGEGSIARWRLGNPNPSAVTVQWTGGSQTFSYGYVSVATNYDASQVNPEVVFSQAGLPDQTVEVSDQSCGQQTEGCVDGYVRDNLDFQWSPSGIVSVQTVGDQLLCDDVTVYLTDYTLPSTYDGSGVFDDSSIPQEKFASAHVVLAKGTTGGATLQIDVPDACTDYQLDLYYAPEVNEVSYSGHGAQLIYGDIYLHTKTDCTKDPGTGGSGGGSVLGASTTASAPGQQLADTGQSAVFATVGAITLMALAATVNFSLIRRLTKFLAR